MSSSIPFLAGSGWAADFFPRAAIRRRKTNTATHHTTKSDNTKISTTPSSGTIGPDYTIQAQLGHKSAKSTYQCAHRVYLGDSPV